MTAHYLRVEAVNLEPLLGDTDRLSVIRGGSFMALDAAEVLKAGVLPGMLWRWLKRLGQLQVKTVVTGASIGLYVVTLPRFLSVPFRDAVAAWLNEQYPHLCLVVDIAVKGNEDAYRVTNETVIARNRWRQMQQPGVVLVDGESSDDAVCVWDGLRPGSISHKSGPVSRSAWKRSEYGQEKKKKFINDLVKLADQEYAQSFEEIATQGPDRRLDGKMALLYFDGNDFGKRQRKCRSEAEMKKFEDRVQDMRKWFLTDLVSAASQDDDFKDPVGKLRLELLRWGGDDLLLIVPAWKGLETLYRFYREMQHAQRGEQDCLTHAGALVFANHKTPIDRLVALAQDVVETIKRHPDGKTQDFFAYVALESMDYPVEPFAGYLASRYTKVAATCWRPLVASAGCDAARNKLAELRDGDRLPRRRLHKGVLKLVNEEEEEPFEKSSEALEGALAAGLNAEEKETLKAMLDARDKIFADQAKGWQWLHILELWDYFAPRSRS